jgi:phosphomannomutase
MDAKTLNELVDAAKRWLDGDPDAGTQAELRELLGAPDVTKTDLVDRFAAALEFGTAGLRGVIGAGPNRMNRAVVLTTTWGLAEFLKEQPGNTAHRGVVVGFDGRRMSREFAEDTVGVLTAAGFRVFAFEDCVPTPLVAYAVKALGAAAGVMVTASHNPPEYNGYKVYWGNGAQIIPPVDSGIAAAIAESPPAREVPRLDRAEAKARNLYVTLGEDSARAYLDGVRALAVHASGDRGVPIVYTPMHGVGDALARRAFAEAGFTNVTSVPEQQAPDGAFPTVAFPNPEEKGAMDLAFALARKVSAELVLANDPDADRLAVAVPDAASPTGYFQLTGNQVGILLGHYLLTEKAAGDKKRLVLASLVSSPALGAIARELGVRYEETLTGFKWIANRAMELERTENLAFVFGYEEALGYTVGDLVRDKDGISAAVLMAEIAAVLKTRGRTVQAELEAIARRFGLFVSTQVNVTRKGVEGAKEIRGMMARLRGFRPGPRSTLEAVSISDLAQGKCTYPATGETRPLPFPKSDVLVFDLAEERRIIARPSGTEPKAKFYFDVRERVRGDEPIAETEKRAQAALGILTKEFMALFESSAP